MKINIKIRLFPQPTETFIVNHITGLLKRGISLKIFTNSYKGIAAYKNPEILEAYDIDRLVNKNFELKSHVPKIFQIIGILCHFRILKYAVKYYLLRPSKSLEPIYHLYNYKDFDDSLVCHVQFNTSLKPFLDLTAIGYLNPKKLIITFHGYDAFRLNKDVFYQNYSKFYNDYVSLVTVNSNYIKSHLVEAGISKHIIKVIPVGIDVDMYDEFSKYKSNQEIKLVTVGRLIQLKGQKYGMRVLKKLLDLGYNATYTIVGRGLDDFTEALKEEARMLDCDKNVIFTGYKSQQETKKILLDSSVFLMTSTYDNLTGRQEAFGLVNIEAQACGLPVIAFNTGGVSETIIDRQTGFLVEDRNVEEMTHKVILLHQDHNLYTQMRYQARQNALENFDNKKLINQYIDIYNQIA